MPRHTILLNTHTFAASQFFNHSANSAAVFNGQLLLARDDGLFVSSGDSDGMQTVGEDIVPIQIDAHVTLPVSDLGYNGEKGPRSIVLSGSFDGAMSVSLASQGRDDAVVNTKTYTTPEISGRNGCKLALDSDQRSRLMQFTISNVDGCDFSLKAADLTFIPGTERRL